MNVSRHARILICLALSLVATAVAVVRVAPLGPQLDIKVLHISDMEGQDIYDLRISSRGGEVIDEVRIEVLRGQMRVAAPGYTTGLRPDTHYRARVLVAKSTEVPPAVRVTQKARVGRSYDVELVEASQ